MSSSDVRDVLNLGDSSGSRPSKKQKTTGARPNIKGLAREVLNLGGDNPIAIVPQTTQFKKRRFVSRKPAAKWELRRFRNSGRGDQSLVLRHWRRKDTKDESGAAASQDTRSVGGGDQLEQEGGGGQQLSNQGTSQVGEVEDSTFAKFNVKVQVPHYSRDQYSVSLQNEDWTMEETDYLMEMASEFDLRWAVIWDRYEWTPSAMNGETDADGDESKAVVPASRPRSMEDLKARYYEVAAKMMAAQKPVQYMTQQEYALHELMAHFNPKQEKVRKEFAINTLSRSKEEAREEESLLLEIKRILARSERFNEERRELYNRLDYPRAETDISSFKSSAGLQTLLQNLMNVDKSKKRKSIMGTDGANTPSNGSGGGAAAAATGSIGGGGGGGGGGGQASGAQAGAQNPSSTANDAGRRDSAAASTAATRESTAATSTPTAGSKKGQQHQQQPQPQQQQQQHQQQQEKQQALERRKLTSEEEAVYGVTHHDRLGSGPTFRTEKINKLFSHKSHQQQLRITNTLNELDVPAKLAMPTAATTFQYEQLLAAVNSLLDARKVSDKLDAEIKIELAKKAELEKIHGPPPSPAPVSSGPEKGSEDEDKVAKVDEDKKNTLSSTSASTSASASASASTSAATPTTEQKKLDGSSNNTKNHDTEDADADSDANAATPAAAVHSEDNTETAQQAEDTDNVTKQEQEHGHSQDSTKAGDREKTAPRSVSSGYKRSASVLSSVSDASAKRQKK
ncbi:swr complex subunit [Claviceps digitariae]|nr:swr complex subunit [Claviceps digitariae]